MATNNNNEFPLKKDEYLAFSATTIKQFIRDRLNQSAIVTDQNFEGSHISTIIDIVAYTFNTLIFYLNRTSTESMFSDAQIYENMNRIVKLIDYKPIGHQTSTLSFVCSASDTGVISQAGVYTIPRYSYLQLNGAPYSFNEDITFSRTTSNVTEALTEVSEQKLLYQGKFQEYPIYNATGNENEVVYLNPGENVIIDHFNIHIYIKEAALDKWEQWEQTPSLYLEISTAKKYEIRFNENKSYEIKFGNDINGKRLRENDQIAIYYLQSNGEEGEVGVNALLNQALTPYNTIQYNEILADVIAGQYSVLTDLTPLIFDNNSISTYSDVEETPDNIRQHAPATFRSQYRLVTQNDYETYIKTNFANLIHDVKVFNNWEYMAEYVKYFYDLGITNPNDISRALYNQLMFADACNFNNVYLFAVPKIISNAKNTESFLTPSQKELIISSMRSEKILTSESVIMDPVYMSASIGISKTTAAVSIDDTNYTQLVILKQPSSRRDNNSIQNDVNKVFLDYFDRKNITLGQTVDIKTLTSNILSINGVKTFYTQRTDDPTIQYEGLSMLIWNPIYTGDTTTLLKNITLPYFKFIGLYNNSNFVNLIKVQSESKIYEGIEY